MDRLLALKFAYRIITEKRNANRYSGTVIGKIDDDGPKATYGDVLTTLEQLFNEEQEKRQEATHDNSTT